MNPCKYLDICKEGKGSLCYNYDCSIAKTLDNEYKRRDACSKFKICPEASEQCNEHYQSICKKLENYLCQ